ncbi:lysozyme inhibitor LprI family protein [Variovorax sp. CCNWLW186]|uniref:lysozyme inhibitor LprI family protein n=1 Tax=Variovorax sp. CCNWLW186 TaxID=3127473 RepID=UPI0030769106
MMVRRVTWCGATTVLLALSACSSGSEISCSAPEVKTTLEQLVWEGAEAAIARKWSVQDGREIIALVKPRLSLDVSEIATVPAEKGGRPTCEASLVGTATQDIDTGSMSLRAAMDRDPNLKVSGKELRGSVKYTVQPTDDGKGFRVSARGTDAYSAGLAGLGVAFMNEAKQARLAEAGKDSSGSPVVAQPVAPAVTTAEPPPPSASASDPRGDAEADLQTADKALNAAYQNARSATTEAGKNALRDEQRAWIKTRDSACSEAKISADSKGDIAGGSAMALEVAGCKARLTEARTKQLAAKS